MSHRTRSWNNQVSTCRCVAGNDWPAEGGKAAIRRVGCSMTLDHQEAVGQHHQSQMAMEAIPPPPLVVIQSTLPLGIFIELLNDPAGVRNRDQPLQRHVSREVGIVVFALSL